MPEWSETPDVNAPTDTRGSIFVTSGRGSTRREAVGAFDLSATSKLATGHAGHHRFSETNNQFPDTLFSLSSTAI